MPSAKFIVESKIESSFRVEKIKGIFDIEMDSVVKKYVVDIPIENIKWNVGLIVGSSGSGKTTIAKKVFGDFKLFNGFEWSSSSIVDDFSEELSPKKIVEALSKVGFSSPPDWLKPFSVLSNGQKMRAELARLILEFDEPILYDEFTSVVDRGVAKIGSAAIQRFVRGENKQFIAISCHDDIKEWLEPDWVYNTDEKKFSRGSLRRPKIKVDIRKAEQSEWELFKEFHYLSSTHNRSAHKYIAEIEGKAVGWCSVLHQPNAHVKNMKRLHRTVIKPDYQGVGIGSRLRAEVAEIYIAKGFRVCATNSSPALIFSMIRSKWWAMTRKPSKKEHSKTSSIPTSCQRLTASFEYIRKA